MAEDVHLLVWKRNEIEIEDFTIRDLPQIERQRGLFRVYLDNSTIDEERRVINNITSRLVAAAVSGFRSGDRIECFDNTRNINVTASQTLNYYLMGKCYIAKHLSLIHI